MVCMAIPRYFVGLAVLRTLLGMSEGTVTVRVKQYYFRCRATLICRAMLARIRPDYQSVL